MTPESAAGVATAARHMELEQLLYAAMDRQVRLLAIIAKQTITQKLGRVELQAGIDQITHAQTKDWHKIQQQIFDQFTGKDWPPSPEPIAWDDDQFHVGEENEPKV